MINAKRLHIHSAPLLAFVVIASSVIAVSAAALSYAVDGPKLLQAAFHPAIKAVPVIDGTAKVELNKPIYDTPSEQPGNTRAATPETIPGLVDNTGASSPAGASNLGEAVLLQASADAQTKR